MNKFSIIIILVFCSFFNLKAQIMSFSSEPEKFLKEVQSYLGVVNKVDAKQFAKEFEPIWLGNKRLHASHRSNLLRKKPDFYKNYGWKEPHDLPYYWYGYAKSDQQTNLFITEEEE